METSRDQIALVLEDEALIAIYLEELLLQAGFDSISTYSSCVAATEWLQGHTPELVVMETRLRDGACDEIAAILAERGVPYIVHSVERDIGGLHPRMETKCRWVDKPCNPDEFIRAVKDCLPDHKPHMH